VAVGLFGLLKNKATGESVRLSEAKLLPPVQPGKMVALVDNYHALVAKLNHAVPPEPLYFLKGNNSFLAHGETIRVPGSFGWANSITNGNSKRF